MNKKLLAMGLAVMMTATAVASAAGIDDLKASVQKFRNPTGTYVMKMNIPFTNLDPMHVDSTIDIQAQPYCARVKNVVSMGKQAPQTSWIYEEMKSANQLITYTQEQIKKEDKTKTWVYEIDPIAPGETIMNAVNPNTLFDSLQSATLASSSGQQKRYTIKFDCAKLFSNFGVEHTLKEGTATGDPKVTADFEKEFGKLRKSGTMDGTAIITNGVLTHISADITKPVRAFENVIKRGVARQSHTGALGNWILGMILHTGKSTLEFELLPLQENISIPAEVRSAAIPKPEPHK